MASYNLTNNKLDGVQRCPHCGVASPNLSLIHAVRLKRRSWSMYFCESCHSGVMVESGEHDHNSVPDFVERVYPPIRSASDDLPEKPRRYLSQALSSLHNPDGAVMLLGATMDAILKDKGYSTGSVYARIDEAKAANLLTEDMAEWAHAVRLGSNRPRHADADDGHVTSTEAEQALEYVQTLVQLLYVLPKRIATGRSAIDAASRTTGSV